MIAELAITEPGKAPAARLLPATASPSLTSAVGVIAAGCLRRLQPLIDLGQAWLGLGVTAGYSHFGIKPS